MLALQEVNIGAFKAQINLFACSRVHFLLKHSSTSSQFRARLCGSLKSDQSQMVRTKKAGQSKKKEAEDEVDIGSEEEGSKKRKAPKAKAEKSGDTPKRPKKNALTEPVTTEDGWTLHPPSLIYRGFAANDGALQIAAFDLDGTLALQKSTLQFPRDADDWRLYNDKVPEKLKKLKEEGYKIVIFSNQGGIKSALQGVMAQKISKRVSNILEAAGIPEAAAVLATNKDENRKPETGMWKFFIEHGNSKVEPDKSKSFFVGDAADATTDFADSDRKFAEAIGIDFKTPKDYFGEPAGKLKAAAGPSKGFNDEMAQAFRDLADQTEASGGSAFGARAYRKAADIIAGHGVKITSGKELSKLQGIGKGTVARIDEFLANGGFEGVKKDPEIEEKKAEDTNMALKFL